MKSRLKRLLRKARQPVTERRVLDTALELLGEEPEEYLVASELFRRKACALRAEGRFEQASLAIRRALRSCWVDVQLCQLEQALNARKMGDLDLAFRAAQEFVWHGGDPAILPEELEKHAEWIRARHPDLGVDRGSNLFVEDDVELSEVDETGLVWRSVGVLWTVASRRDVLTTMHLVGEGNDPNSSFRIGDRTETVLGCIVATDRVEAVQELLSLGAKPAAGVASPMLCARSPEMVEFLEDQGVDVEAVGEDGHSLLVRALLIAEVRLCVYLLSRGIGRHDKTRDGRTVQQIVEVGVEQGIDDYREILSSLRKLGPARE